MPPHVFMRFLRKYLEKSNLCLLHFSFIIEPWLEMALCCMNSRWQQYYYYSLYSERVCQTKVFFKITVLKCSFYFNRVLINTTNIYFNIVTNVFYLFLSRLCSTLPLNGALTILFFTFELVLILTVLFRKPSLSMSNGSLPFSVLNHSTLWSNVSRHISFLKAFQV